MIIKSPVNYQNIILKSCFRLFHSQKVLNSEFSYLKKSYINFFTPISSYMSITHINSRIEKEFCYKTFYELTEERLFLKYKNSSSVKKKIFKLNYVLSNYVKEEDKEKIIKDYLSELIPPGTKSVTRGNRFNEIVEDFINNIELENKRFEVCFEKICKGHFTTEIPDWYILDKKTDKIIIGMNQVDLWGGGHQLNRGVKYILNNENNNKNTKLVCVVCNKIYIKSVKNKVFKLFKIGFENNTLCYLNNLKNIIYTYFKLN